MSHSPSYAVLGLVLGLVGCVGRLDASGKVPDDGAAGDSAVGAPGGGAAGAPDLGPDPENPEPSCDPGCLLPVADHVDMKYVVWCEEGVHLYIPKPSWAMAAVHASRLMSHYTGDIRTAVSPNWFIATALKESYMGCDPSLPPDPQHPEHQWKPRESSYADGCFQITPPPIVDLANLFPGNIPNDHPGLVSGDHFETSAVTMAFFHAFTMVRACAYTGGRSARDLLSNMADPQGQLKVFTIGYNQGLYNDAEFGKALRSCAQAPEVLACIWGPTNPGYDYGKGEVVNCPGSPYLQASEALPYSHAVGQYVTQLDTAASEGHCYDETFTESDVLAYVGAISRLLPRLATPDARAAISAAFALVAKGEDSVSFQGGFPKVLEVIESLQGELPDPWLRVPEIYGIDNPRQCDVVTPYLPAIDETCESLRPVPH